MNTETGQMNEKGFNPIALQILASFLAYGVVEGVRFNMAGYSDWGSDDFSRVPRDSCGTSGCAVGWGTFLFTKHAWESFIEYSERVFMDMGTHTHRWHWCFSGAWARHDNTRLGAAKRIQYLLDNNGELPKGWAYNAETVALYQSTQVKRETRPQAPQIAELIEKLSREPRFRVPVS